jgi:glycosyltransferase involved in cell wall biosynthesis
MRLTIAIPTFNRAAYLAECLESLVREQCPGLEIIVCDNASVDSTQAVVESYLRRLAGLRYIKNDKNIGPDANFLKCLYSSDTDFIWLMSDDDIVLPGAVSNVMKVAERNPGAGLIILNHCGGFFDVAKAEECGAPAMPVDPEVVLTGTHRVLQTAGVYVTFVSTLVFNSKAVKEIKNPKKYIGTNLLQAYLAYEAALNAGESVLIGRPCVAARAGNSGGYQLFKVFCRNWHALLYGTGVRAGLPRKMARRIFSDTIARHLRYWLIMEKAGKGNFGIDPRYLFPESLSYISAWLRLYPVLMAPRKIIRLLAIRRGLLK